MNKLAIHNATLLYDKRGISGLRNINASFSNNHITSIVGPSGSGKTTLLNVLSGKLTLDSGNISKENFKVVTLEQHFDFDGEQKVLEALTKDSSRPDDTIEEVRFWLDELEITNEMNKKLNELSAGQKQRVHIISALIQKPDFLLFDEPFGHLDIAIRKEIISNLLPNLVKKNIGVIWVTHDLISAFCFSDKMAVMNYGEILQFDSPENIYNRPYSLFVAQFTGEANILLASSRNKLLNSILSKPETDMASGSKTPMYLLRPERLLIDNNSDIRAKKIKSYFQGDCYLSQLQIFTDETIWVKTSAPIQDELGIKAHKKSLWQLPSL